VSRWTIRSTTDGSPIRALGAARRALGEQRPFFEFESYVQLGIELLTEVAPPGGEGVDEPGDGVLVHAELRDAEASAEPIVAVRFHTRDVPRLRSRFAKAQHRGDDVVAIGEDVRLDQHFVADDTLDGEPSGVDLGPDGLNYHAAGGHPALPHRSEACVSTDGQVLPRSWM
jgi:hypothetical protein